MISKRPVKRKKNRTPEMLDAYDNDMNFIGSFVRPAVHYNRMWHKVAQCWIIGLGSSGPRVFLQRRSFEKKSNPGRYDVSAGGHVSAGEEPKTAMVREIQEETGLILKEHHLIEIGTCQEVSGHDREIAHIFVHFEIDPPFYPGKEVIYMVSADLEDFKALSEGSVDSITVVPAIRTGPMQNEAFVVNQDNFCNHESFVTLVYPYVKKYLEENGFQPGGLES